VAREYLKYLRAIIRTRWEYAIGATEDSTEKRRFLF
jgi:hypothetical protein